MLLAGKKGIIFGVANDKSLAWSAALAAKEQGAQVFLSYLGPAQEKRLAELEAKGHAFPRFACDFASDESIDAFFAKVKETFGTIDFLIHSVAYTERRCLHEPFHNTSRKDFLLTMDISAYSLVAAAQRAFPLMPHGGSIISLTYLGSEKAVPNYNVMGVAKAALECATRYLAQSLGPLGIRVNTVSAGPVRTLAASAIPGFSSILKTVEQNAPLRRNVTAHDVARAIVFLASDLSSGITGENIHVDSGFHAIAGYAGATESIEERS